MDQDNSIRLNKYLALKRGISRREADDMIARGDVTLDGRTVELGARVLPDSQVSLHGQPLGQEATELIYIALYKPVGYVCSRRQQGSSPTIYELLPPKYQPLKAVGRLDRDSSGLILLSNDGDFAFRMTHPKFMKTKVYELTLDRELEPLHQQMIADYGVSLDDGVSKLGLARLSGDDRRTWQVTMSEGRNRQIRRTFASLGYNVETLRRTQFGGYSLHDIKNNEPTLVDMR